ncbi:MAG TPA: conjugal transfer protein TrbD [Syntrophobacteraceae bacterium]|jgi:type IV secretion system protein TrbD|nr:conjugal transfer protein TrbD [Syntrophobacteraceae bacterium]
MDEPRRIPIHRSLNRPQMMLGGERELVLFAALLAVLIVVSGMNLFSFLTGLALWSLAIAVLIRMGRVDPELSKVYQRHIRYRAYYPPKTGAHAPAATVPSWKV